MASTISLQDTMNWAGGFVNYVPLINSSNNEPAITTANIIKQTILGPPFAWRWNRAVKANVALGQNQDVTAAISDFGYLEQATIQNTAQAATAVNPNSYALQVNPMLGVATESARPSDVCTFIDDNAGNITFRHLPIPDVTTYQGTYTYQKKATLFAALADTWSPIPDEYSYIYQYGFLTLALFYADNSMAQFYNQRFVAHLLGAADGLTNTARDIFLANWSDLTMQAKSQMSQQGIMARGAS